MFTLGIAFSLLFGLVAAQYGGGVNPPATTAAATTAAAVPSAPANTAGNVFVNVAPNGNFVFSPSNFTAPNGTLVTFFFPNSPVAHSVTQSSFADPCTHLAASSNNSAGFDSGLVTAKQFTINITDDSKPIWFHCKQVTHCGLGMVGSINAPSSGNTFQEFQAAALKIGTGEATETDTGAVTGGFNAVATAPPAATFSASSSSSNANGSKNSGTRVVANAGVGLLALFVVIVFA